MEEQVLAERCRQGDNLARKELYERYAGRMLGVCLRYAGDRETAQDLMHDGFLKLFDSFDKFTWRGAGLDGTCYGEYRIAVFAEERCDEPVCCFG